MSLGLGPKRLFSWIEGAHDHDKRSLQMALKPITKKPSRAQLLDVITQLQGLVGEAIGAAWNDRAHDRITRIIRPLDEGFDLCVSALAFDAPRSV